MVQGNNAIGNVSVCATPILCSAKKSRELRTTAAPKNLGRTARQASPELAGEGRATKANFILCSSRASNNLTAPFFECWRHLQIPVLGGDADQEPHSCCTGSTEHGSVSRSELASLQSPPLLSV